MLTPKGQKQLLEISRQTLKEYLNQGTVPEIEAKSEELNRPGGAFVTLKKKGKLRGCIGLLESNKPIWQVVQEQTLAAAITDPRFTPLRPSELPATRIEISILTPLKKVNSWKDIQLGEDGVVISQGKRGGVFLPQVAQDTGWDLETFLTNLCQHKAGLPADAWKDPQCEFKVFQAQIIEEPRP